MFILFVFYTKGLLDSVSEGFDNAAMNEQYLMSRYNDVKVLSIIGNDDDKCWLYPIPFKYQERIGNGK